MQKKQNDVDLPFEIASPQEKGTMYVSKWQDFHLSISPELLGELFAHLGEVVLIKIGQCIRDGVGTLSREEYTRLYAASKERQSFAYRRELTCALSASYDTFYWQQTAAGGIVRALYPYFQLRLSGYIIDGEGKVHTGALGESAHFWGIHIAYPLLYMNAKEGRSYNVATEGGFVNTPLYKKLARWVRHNTRPANIAVGDTTVRTTLRYAD